MKWAHHANLRKRPRTPRAAGRCSGRSNAPAPKCGEPLRDPDSIRVAAAGLVATATEALAARGT